MDFIEQLTGLSPDGGSGVLEVLWLMVPLALVGVLVFRRRRRRAKDKV